MVSAPVRTRVTAEEFLEMPESAGHELLDGELVEVHVSLLSSRVGMIVGRILNNHCPANDLGLVFGADLYYRCFRDSPAKLRKPDISFIRRDADSDHDATADPQSGCAQAALAGELRPWP